MDASRSRLYLLERPIGPDSDAGFWRIASEHPVSLGRNGVDKRLEGDARTPLGVYHVSSRLAPPALDRFYGPGALTLDYPNALDRREGRTGHSIWLHGSAPEVPTRPPRDTDGCLVLDNDALIPLLRRIAPGTAPVLIAHELRWSTPEQMVRERTEFEAVLASWKRARQKGDRAGLSAFYAPEVKVPHGRMRLEFKDVGLLAWPDGQPVVQVTLGEIPKGRMSGVTRRQHWIQEQGKWRIFEERTWK